MVVPGGVRWLFLIVAVFFFVTAHELCHSLAARHFGIMVREITLLPIGGIASMSKMPERPGQEFLISIAGPLFNIAVILVFFYPIKYLLGPGVVYHALSTDTWPLTFAYVYWINLILALFNLIPAFPMDGGRLLRALLAVRLGYQKATRVAVTFGHLFALLFAYQGIVKLNLILILIAVFIYMAASNEEMQVNVKETLKKFKVRDILPRELFTIDADATLARVLETIFHSHQEDFPVVAGTKSVGFITRQDIMASVHRFGTEKPVRDIMRTDFASVKEADSLVKAQAIMHENNVRALPVMNEGRMVGVITLEDIGRVYSMVSIKS
jgi:Zn-dependent protease/CBS domain-containing protein